MSTPVFGNLADALLLGADSKPTAELFRPSLMAGWLRFMSPALRAFVDAEAAEHSLLQEARAKEKKRAAANKSARGGGSGGRGRGRGGHGPITSRHAGDLDEKAQAQRAEMDTSDALRKAVQALENCFFR